MKKNLYIVLLLLAPICALAQESYRAFVEDGKAWVGAASSSTPNGDDRYLYFDGDTTIAGHSAKRLYLLENGNTSYICSMYEEGKRVYGILSGTTAEHLIFDFSLQAVGESATIDNCEMVLEKIDTITVHGQPFRRLYLTGDMVWVEGIGSEVIRYNLDHVTSGMRLLGCMSDGVEVFSGTDFSRSPADTRDRQPVAVSGKSWDYHYTDLSNPGIDYDYRYYIDGDTLINGLKRLKLYSYNRDNDGQSRYETAWFEAGGCIFSYDASEKEDYVIYDFSSPGQRWRRLSFRDFTISRETKDIHGVARDVVSFSRKTSSSPSVIGCWVEGVGSVGALLSPLSFPLRPGHRLVRCEQEGRILFEYSDLGMPEEQYDDPVAGAPYEPMFKTGKYWKYMQTRLVYIDDVKVDTTYVDYRIVGDTIIDGRRCWRMDKETDGLSEPFAVWLEEDGKVYMQREDGKWAMLFNFSHVKYLPYVFGSESYYLDAIDMVSLGGRNHNRYWYVGEDGLNARPLCIEGIGTYNGVVNVEGIIAGWSTLTLVGVYEDSECIFIPKDFYKEAVSDDIESVSVKPSATPTGAVYDLQGRRLLSLQGYMLPKGIYIQNGKKFVMK